MFFHLFCLTVHLTRRTPTYWELTMRLPKQWRLEATVNVGIFALLFGGAEGDRIADFG
jgi:hypothetical protein